MKILKSTLLLLLLIITSCAYDNDDNYENIVVNPEYNTIEAIPVDSDLFEYLTEIATDEDEAYLNITCIDFAYPLTIFVFDETDTYVATHSANDDTAFSALLESLAIDYSISVSFPITSTLESGEEFIINTKEELKSAIDNCLEEELILDCEGYLRDCVWKVGYSYTDDNTYLGGIFREDDGAANFIIDYQLYNGSWTVFLIESELHINIHLIHADETGEFFNFDWKVEFLDSNTLRLFNEDREVILNQRCDADFENCTNFIFEACETVVGSEVSEFILDDYAPCIFDTLELDEAFEISYHLTEEDALDVLNPIASDVPFSNTENTQTIYVRIEDTENDMQYYVEITLYSISC